MSRVIDGRTIGPRNGQDPLAQTSEWIDRQRTRWEALCDVVGEYLRERADAR